MRVSWINAISFEIEDPHKLFCICFKTSSHKLVCGCLITHAYSNLEQTKHKITIYTLISST